MFERKTIFVIGAGASKELGLPTGGELKGKIADKLNIRFEGRQDLGSGDPGIVSAIDLHASIAKDKISKGEYFQAGRLISDAMPLAISIDNFLHTHHHNPHITLMGKLGIAQSILRAEKRSLIYNEQSGRSLDFTKTEDAWHTTFCKMLCEGVALDQLDDIFENVAFIIFNYDRCIEHFLAHALARYFDIDRQRARELVEKLTIIHPYGQVGRLPWQKKAEDGGVAFGEDDLTSSRLLTVASQIKTFTERVEDDTRMTQMRALLAEAKAVVYLGFSYGEMNLELLQTKRDVTPKVFGTAFEISEANIRVIKQDLPKAFGHVSLYDRPQLTNLPCHEFLNQYWKPILRG